MPLPDFFSSSLHIYQVMILALPIMVPHWTIFCADRLKAISVVMRAVTYLSKIVSYGYLNYNLVFIVIS